MVRRSRFVERKIVSAVFPDHADIMGRVAIMRNKKGREDIALLHIFFATTRRSCCQNRVLESL